MRYVSYKRSSKPLGENKLLVRTDVIPWENCGELGKSLVCDDISGIELHVGDYIRRIAFRNNGEVVDKIEMIFEQNNKPATVGCPMLEIRDGIRVNHNEVINFIGSFPTYRHSIDPSKDNPSFVSMSESEFYKQRCTFLEKELERILKHAAFEFDINCNVETVSKIIENIEKQEEN